MPSKRACRVPGCDAVIGGKNLAGVCDRHRHKPGFCACRKCGPLQFQDAPPPRPPRGFAIPTKSVMIHAPAAASSMEPTRHSITMPRAPWEPEQRTAHGF